MVGAIRNSSAKTNTTNLLLWEANHLLVKLWRAPVQLNSREFINVKCLSSGWLPVFLIHKLYACTLDNVILDIIPQSQKYHCLPETLRGKLKTIPKNRKTGNILNKIRRMIAEPKSITQIPAAPLQRKPLKKFSDAQFVFLQLSFQLLLVQNASTVLAVFHTSSSGIKFRPFTLQMVNLSKELCLTPTDMKPIVICCTL